MHPQDHFKPIARFGKVVNLALALFFTFSIPITMAWDWMPWDWDLTEDEWFGLVCNSILWSVLFWAGVGFWPEKNRMCRNSGTLVTISEILDTCTFEVLGVTDSTRAVTSANAVSGVTNTGGQIGVGFGSIESTSHVPIKLGRLKFTASCPSCKAIITWNEDREITQWTSPSGQVSYEVVGRVNLP